MIVFFSCSHGVYCEKKVNFLDYLNWDQRREINFKWLMYVCVCVCVCVWKEGQWAKMWKLEKEAGLERRKQIKSPCWLSSWFDPVNAQCSLSHFSRVWLFVTLWTLACQAPLSMGFFRQGYWNGLPCPPPGDLPDPGIEPVSPALAGKFFITTATREAPVHGNFV